MAVSKRLRFEILRRDNHACRYCGASAPTVVLTVDHITPVALGGTDAPENLVAACVDCNAGKTSTVPDQEHVEAAEVASIEWAAAVQLAAEKLRQERAGAHAEDLERFHKRWTLFTNGYGDAPLLPPDWHHTVGRQLEAGLSIEDVLYAVDVAMGASKVPGHAVFAYYCGVCKNLIAKAHELAAEILAAQQ